MSYTTLTDMIVSGVKRSKLNLPSNRYTGHSDERQDYWKVSVRYAKIPGRSIDLWYRDEPDARRIAIKGIVPLDEMMLLLSPFGYKFVSTQLGKDPKAAVMNPYTDRVSAPPTWHATMWCEQDGRYADLWYGEGTGTAGGGIGGGDAAAAAMWAPNMAYSPFDFLRVFNIIVVTYPAEPNFVAEISTGGFIDRAGYHMPGKYPGGGRPAGIELGNVIPLGPSTPVGTAVSVNSMAKLQALAKAQGIPGWVIVEVFG